MTGTNSTENAKDGVQEALKIMKLVGYTVVFIAGVLLNILLFLAVTRKRIRHRNTAKTFIIIIRNLAVADLLLLVSTIPFDAAWHESNQFPYGPGMCRFLWPFQTACFQAVVFTYVVLSFHRTYGVKAYLFGQMKSAFGYIICLAIWLASIATVIPYMVFLQHTSGEVDSCDEEWELMEHRKAYTVVLFLLQYLIPLGLMIVFAFVTKTELKNYSHRSNSTAVVERRDRHHRVNAMLILYLVVFAVLLLPHQIMWFMLDFGNGANARYFFDVLNFLYVFTYSITVTNVVLFFIYNGEFQSDMWYFLRCYCCRSDSYSVRDDESDSFSIDDPGQQSLHGGGSFQLEQRKAMNQGQNNEANWSSYNPSNSMEL